MGTKFFLNYLRFLIPVVFFLIALGGAVRAMHAGLACPDWPLCFGKLIPDFQVQVYYEFIHRVIAGFVGILTLILTLLVFFKKLPSQFKKTILIADVVLLVQIVMGGLTVLHLLKFETVTLHLIFGLSFLCCLLWLYFQFQDFESLDKNKTVLIPGSVNLVMSLVFIMVFIQIVLGGAVSSNYAGLTCETFPLCYGEFFPTFEGLIGLHVMHRTWGYLTVLAVLSMFHMIWKNRKQPWMTSQIFKLSKILLVLIVLQVAVGAVNVLFKLPPLITVLHTFLAAAIVATLLKLFYLGQTFATTESK